MQAPVTEAAGADAQRLSLRIHRRPVQEPAVQQPVGS